MTGAFTGGSSCSLKRLTKGKMKKVREIHFNREKASESEEDF